jgi:peptidoglycan/LPS O-acetylase OafA/YrhL
MKKWQLIDLVRSFSIIAVMAAHANHFLIKPGNPFWAEVWDRFQVNGSSGVFLFFTVSGFLISHVIANNPGGLMKPDIRKFYVQRAGRILPLLLLMVLFATVLSLFESHTHEFSYFYGADYKNPLFWFSISVFSFNWWLLSPKSFDIYGLHWCVLWSLSIEEQFYFIFPIALKKMVFKRRLILFLIAVIVVAFLYRCFFYLYDPANRPLQHFNSLGVFDLIAIGILTYLVFDQYADVLARNTGVASSVFVFGLVLLGVTYWIPLPDWMERVCAPPLLAFGAAGILLGGIQLSFFDSKYFKIFSWPGKYCYCNYLIHPTVLYFIYPVLHRMNVFLAFLVYVIISTCISAASFHFFEMPTNQWIRMKFMALNE